MTKTITLTEAVERITKVATERPDRVAEGAAPSFRSSCRYFNYDGTPSCIVGTAFADELRAAGVPDDEDVNCSTGVESLVELGKLDLDADATDFLALAQQKQDNGHRWIEVLSSLDNWLENHGHHRSRQLVAA